MMKLDNHLFWIEAGEIYFVQFNSIELSLVAVVSKDGRRAFSCPFNKKSKCYELLEGGLRRISRKEFKKISGIS